MIRYNVLAALGASACLLLSATAATAMPIEQDYYAAPGVTKEGRLDIKEVDDNSTEMEMRLSQQLMVLQRQILDLQRELAAVKAAQPQ
jgi:hypothetical protein